MSKVYVLIPCCNDFMDVVITNDSDSGIRVFKTKEQYEQSETEFIKTAVEKRDTRAL
jgi:hypothetical protein